MRGKRECSNSNPAPAKDVTVFDRPVRGLASSGNDSESSRARRERVGERSDWGVRGGDGELLSGLYEAILFSVRIVFETIASRARCDHWMSSFGAGLSTRTPTGAEGGGT